MADRSFEVSRVSILLMVEGRLRYWMRQLVCINQALESQQHLSTGWQRQFQVARVGRIRVISIQMVQTQLHKYLDLKLELNRFEYIRPCLSRSIQTGVLLLPTLNNSASTATLTHTQNDPQSSLYLPNSQFWAYET